MKLVVGEGSCGLAAGAGAVYERLDTLRQESNPSGVVLDITGCNGMCFLEPIVDVYDDDGTLHRYVRVTEKDADDIYAAATQGDLSLIGRLGITPDEAHFLEAQTRVALRDCGLINPENIDDYIARDGYKAIEKILKTGMTQDDVIEQIDISGLRGRGGAGFSTAFKWRAAKNSEGDEKYLICNADEGDPGAFMDRAVIEGDPHNLIEGMLIGAYAIGASTAIVYVRAEYPLARVRLLLHPAHQSRCRRLRLRRRDCPHRVPGRQARHAASETPVPGTGRLLDEALQYQQRRDLRQRPLDHQQRRRRLCRYGYG